MKVNNNIKVHHQVDGKEFFIDIKDIIGVSSDNGGGRVVLGRRSVLVKETKEQVFKLIHRVNALKVR